MHSGAVICVVVVASRQHKAIFSPLQMQTLVGFLFSLLLLSGAASGPDSRRSWRTCGSVQPPADHSLLQYSSNRVRLETSGALQCNCRGDRAKSGDFENVKFSVVDREGKRLVPVHAAVYPCLVAGCDHQVADVTQFSKFDSSSVDLLPKHCSRIFDVHVSDSRVELSATVKGLEDMQIEDCTNLLTIALHQTYSLYGTANISETLTIITHSPFDMDSCAESLKRGELTRLTFYSLYKTMPQSTHHSVIRRDNTPPTFLKSFYSVEVVENSPVGTVVTVVQASDVDQGTNGDITYSMQLHNNLISAEYFVINSTTGEIVTAGTILCSTVYNYNRTN